MATVSAYPSSYVCDREIHSRVSMYQAQQDKSFIEWCSLAGSRGYIMHDTVCVYVCVLWHESVYSYIFLQKNG